MSCCLSTPRCTVPCASATFSRGRPDPTRSTPSPWPTARAVKIHTRCNRRLVTDRSALCDGLGSIGAPAENGHVADSGTMSARILTDFAHSSESGAAWCIEAWPLAVRLKAAFRKSPCCRQGGRSPSTRRLCGTPVSGKRLALECTSLAMRYRRKGACPRAHALQRRSH